MKRNYLASGASALVGLALLASGALAFAATPWKAVLTGNDDVRPSTAVMSLSPKARYLKTHRVGNPQTTINPAQDGLTSIPSRLRERQVKPAPIMRSPEAPRGHIYGVVNRYDGMEYKYEGYLGQLDLASGRLTPIYTGSQFCNTVGEDYVFQAHAYRNGIVWCPALIQEDERTVSYWYGYDLATGKLAETHRFNDYLADGYSIAYDSDNDLFFTCSIGLNGEGDGVLSIVDPNGANGWDFYAGAKMETTDGRQPFIAAITYNPVDKTLYAFDNNNIVYTIEWGGNKALPQNKIVEAGEIAMSDGSFVFETDPSDPMAGQVCYSPMDEMFVAIYRDNYRMVNRITYIHPETFEGIIGNDVKAFATPYITSIFCTDDFAPSDAPTLAETPKVNFVEASLTGDITFTAPDETFIGIKLDGDDLKAVAKVDGNVIDERTVKAGTTYTVTTTLPQGNHKLEYTTAIGDNVSPVATVVFYTGYDAPAPVKGMSLKGAELTWEKPGKVGYNNGFVDVNDITYDVYLNNDKQNSTPIKDNKFTLTRPEDMKNYTISVVATSQGQSSPRASFNKIFGQAYTLPFLQAPTREQSQNYTIINANEDERAFYFSQNLGVHDGMAFVCGYFVDADDWLILPAVKIDDPTKLYQFDMDIRGVMNDLNTSESYEIWLMDEPTLNGKVTQIYSTPNHMANPANPVHMSFNFGVPAAGEYHLAIHVTSTRDQSSQGMSFHNFEIMEAYGKSSAVPGDPTNVSLKAADFGDLAAVATVTLPTVDILGNPLPADDEITITMAYIDETGYEYSTNSKGKPGETITVQNVSDKDGFIVYTLTPSNANGNGYTRSYTIYVGMDIPLHPDNITGVPTEDNMGANVTWDAPGNVGRYGGYVDTEASDFTYRFYTKSGISLQKIADTKETHYTFYPYTDSNSGALATFYFGPSAVNRAGESIESMFVMEDLGNPYELPMMEEWNTTGFTYSPYTFFTSAGYSASMFSNVGNVANLNIGNPTLNQGGLIGNSETGIPSKGKFILPKFTTKGIKKSLFKLRYWDYKNAPKSIQIYGRHSGNSEEELIGEFKLNNPSRGEWVDGEIILPDNFSDRGWVQLLVGTTFTGNASEYLLCDSFQVTDDADYDLKLTIFDGYSQATVGDNVTYTVTVANSGRERMNGKLKVELINAENNKVLDVKNVDIPQLASTQTFDYDAVFNLKYNDVKKAIVRATIESEDENLANNVKEIELSIMPSSIPVVTDLQAVKTEDGNVELSWTAPSVEYGNFENFEGYKPFAISETFDYWTNINGDDLYPVIFQNQSTGSVVRWENDNKKSGWQIYDWNELYLASSDGAVIQGKANIDRLKPHSGKQALIARCGSNEDGEQLVTSKWLVSPELVPQTTFSFWYTTFASDMTEYVEIWTCEKANGTLNPNDKNLSLGRAGDYRKISSKSKNGSEIWELVKYTLGRRECKVALRYVSYDGYAAAIDDISFTPANMLTRNPESYNVYRCDMNGENEELIAEGITDTHFVDTNYNDNNYYYYVKANNTVDGNLVSGPESDRILISSSAVGEINAAQSVVAAKGMISVNGFRGEKIVISAADGKVVVNTIVSSDNVAYAVEKGVYVATVGKRTYKLIVK